MIGVFDGALPHPAVPSVRTQHRSTLPLLDLLLFSAVPCHAVLYRAVEVHADAEEIQYWKEVEQEQLVVASGSDSE